jgi:hypothetical protein
MTARNPRPKVIDGVIVCLTISLMGAPAVLGGHLSEAVQKWTFWGGLACLVLYVAGRWGGWLIGLASEAHQAPTDNRGGAYIGRDNTGQQNVYHGLVTHYHGNAPQPPIQVTAAELPPVTPDWTIRELFHYLAPKGFEDTWEKEAVATEIADKASIGAIKVWGREIDGTKRLALIAIDRDLWRYAEFTYWFLDGPEDGVSMHVRFSSNKIGAAPRDFSDLQVLRGHAEAIWPRGNVSLQAASRLLFEAAERAGVSDALLRTERSPDRILDRFKIAFMSSDAQLYGTKPPSSQSLPIAKSEYAALQPVSGESRLVYHSFATGHAYDDVTIERREMDQLIRRYVRWLLIHENKAI